jgi:outer membrane protein
MKKLFKVALVALCVVLAGNFAKAQTKVGYISVNMLMDQLPEMKTLQKQMADYQKTFSDQLNTMQTEYQTKGQAYQGKQATMTDAQRTAAQTELQDLQQRIVAYHDNAQKQIETKSGELLKPVQDKVLTAIKAVAQEKGYGYVLDSSQTELIVAPPADDLMAAVKVKLGLPAQ